MFSNTDQYTSASKAFFESQIDAISALTNIVVDGTEKIATLNMAAVKASTDGSIVAAKDLLAAKNSQAFLSLPTEYARPNTEKISAYIRDLTDIVSTTQADFSKVAESQVAKVQNNVSDVVDAIAKNAPAGSEDAIAMLKSSVAKGNDGYEKMNSAAKQAVNDTEAHVTKASNKFTEDVKKATTK
jgi:phasin family protein